MRGLTKRAVALPAAALGALALVGLGSGAAHAAVASGSVTLTVSGSFVAQLAKAGVVLVPENAASVTYTSGTNTVAITYTATGGDATLVDFAGTISYSGSILGFSCRGKTVNLTGLLFDLTDAQFDGQTATSGETPLVDLAGSQSGNINGATQTYSSTDLQIDAAGAALLDSALGTKAFTAGQSVGSFSTTWTTS
jgi:hypothetical protein